MGDGSHIRTRAISLISKFVAGLIGGFDHLFFIDLPYDK